jgi:NitT/TauT family transport system substrate-binding protein
MRRLASILLLTGFILTGPAWHGAAAQDRLSFGLDWRAEAEYGGFYEAVATGLYKKHGLDVTIVQGGPQLNQAQLLLAGRLDLMITSNGFLALNFAQEKLPLIAVAAIFQKDPSVLIAHPGQGNDSFAALKGKPIMLGAASRDSWWGFLRARFGYTDAQVRPYNFNLAPFLADPKAVQQGYLGSEPFSIRQEAHFDPVVLLLADAGFQGYASLIATSTKLATSHPDVVQRFLDASFEGWHAYLDGDPAPANALIKADNPEMTDALLDYGRTALKQHAVVESQPGSAAGIGAMTDVRWREFFETVQKDSGYPADLDLARAYTLRFLGNPNP